MNDEAKFREFQIIRFAGKELATSIQPTNMPQAKDYCCFPFCIWRQVKIIFKAMLAGDFWKLSEFIKKNIKKFGKRHLSR